MMTIARAVSRTLIGLLVCAAATAWAATGDISQYLRADHPDAYTVVKGDTLWDISGKFLERPWLWPELWRINPQIENPHLIYPGDTISLVWIDGRPQLVVDRGDGARTVRLSPEGPSGTVSLKAKVRSEPLDTAIPAIRLDAIQSFLVQNRVVEPDVLNGAPYVIQGERERLVLGAGDRLYVRGVLPGDESFNIVRNGSLYVDPDTSEVLGREATYIGLGQAVAQDADIATMLVTNTREEVQIGDPILTTEERRVESSVFPSAPAGDVHGQIIAVFGGVSQVGQFDVVVINRGEREGIEVGNVLAIYKRGALARDRIANEMVQLPSERAGLMMIFRTFEKLSYGLVMMAQIPLAVADEVRNP